MSSYLSVVNMKRIRFLGTLGARRKSKIIFTSLLYFSDHLLVTVQAQCKAAAGSAWRSVPSLDMHGGSAAWWLSPVPVSEWQQGEVAAQGPDVQDTEFQAVVAADTEQAGSTMASL